MSLSRRLRAIVDPLPSGAAVTLPVDAVRAWLEEEDGGDVSPQSLPEPRDPTSWRVLFWTVPPETRIGREELLEAVGRPASWLYRVTSAKEAGRPKPPGQRIPHRKLDGVAVFVVGEVRRWLLDREEIVEAGPLERCGPQIVRGGRERA